MEEPRIRQIGSYSPTSACNAKVLDADGICPMLLDHKGAEPAILTPIRTEEAKRLRREGVIETFENREYVPREDGVSNTITTVQKDNMLFEPSRLYDNQRGEFMRDPMPGLARTLKADHHNAVIEPTSCAMRGRGEDNEQQLEIGGQIANCVTTVQKDSMVLEPQRYRIRKLTPRECFRLMGVEDGDIDKIQYYPFKTLQEREEYLKKYQEELAALETEIAALKAEIKTYKKNSDSGRLKRLIKRVKFLKNEYKALRGNFISKSAQYKLAGNSIVVSCLYHIFRTAFIPKQLENKAKRLLQPSLFD